MAKKSVLNWEGYNSAKELLTTPINYFTQMQNMLIENGQLIKRKQFGNQASSVLDDTPVIFFDAFSSGITYFKVAGLYYKAGFNAGSPTLLMANASFSTLTNANAFQSARENNFLYLASQIGPGWKLFNKAGTPTCEPIGLPVPTSVGSSVVKSALGGSWVANYNTPSQIKWKYSWVVINANQTLESNLIPIVAGSGELAGVLTDKFTIGIQAKPTGYSHITHMRIYRSIDSGATYYRINHGGGATEVVYATTFVDLGDVTYPATSTIPPTTHGQLTPLTVPSAISPTSLAMWKGRMWYGVGDKVYFSELNTLNDITSVEYVQSSSFFNITPYGDPADYLNWNSIQRLVAFPQFLLIICKRSMYIIEGDTPADFKYRIIAPDYGTTAPQSVLVHQGELYFANNAGIFRTTLADKPSNIALQIWKDFDAVRIADTVKSIVSIPDHRTGNIWFITDSSGIFIYNPNIDKFVGIIVITFNAIGLQTFASDGGPPRIMIVDGTKRVRVYEQATSSNESAGMVVAATTGGLIDERAFTPKQYRAIQVATKLLNNIAGNAETIDISVVQQGGAVRVADSNKVLDGTIIKANPRAVGNASLGDVAIRFSESSIDPTKIWSILGFDLEYEPTGNY